MGGALSVLVWPLTLAGEMELVGDARTMPAHWIMVPVGMLFLGSHLLFTGNKIFVKRRFRKDI